MFLEIEKDIRSNKYKSHKLVRRKEVISRHPSNLDLIAWSSGARVGTRFSLTTSSEKFIYIRSDRDDKELIKKACE